MGKRKEQKVSTLIAPSVIQTSHMGEWVPKEHTRYLFSSGNGCPLLLSGTRLTVGLRTECDRRRLQLLWFQSLPSCSTAPKVAARRVDAEPGFQPTSTLSLPPVGAFFLEHSSPHLMGYTYHRQVREDGN